MNQPKRHHWWPVSQAKYWTDTNGLVTVTHADGTRFKANPINIAVESELYTRFQEDDSKDTTIEEWFADSIDGPAKNLIDHVLDSKNTTRHSFRGDPRKAQTARDLGFRINSYVDKVQLPQNIRLSISMYLAALLVRHPQYLAKLAQRGTEARTESQVKNIALEHMLASYESYKEKLLGSVFLLTKRMGSAEYVYADGGLVVQEPWHPEPGIPFDIHAPLTPDIAIQVLPIPSGLNPDLSTASIAEVTNQGISRQNRIILGGAKRFVFSRQEVSQTFIASNFGKPAPMNIGHRIENGRLQTWFDPARGQ